jgi:sortase A
MVVGPDEVWVLDPTDRPMLTLITCYPFNYVGKAPRRFIVRAERTSTSLSKVVVGKQVDEHRNRKKEV